MNQLQAGDQILYQPSGKEKKDSEIAILVVPPGEGELKVLDSHSATKSVQWILPSAARIVGVVYGEQGLNEGKVRSFIKKDPNLVQQLADYADNTAKTETLLEALSPTRQAAPSQADLDTAVVSFASRLGGSGRLNRTAPPEQQLLELLRTVNPALSSYDPLAQDPSVRLQQSAGLAASVAGLFFGNAVGVGAGSAALLVNLKSMVFPRSEFRSSFAQLGEQGDMSLCGRKETAPSRTQMVYFWATRLPDRGAPELTIDGEPHLPVGLKSTVPIKGQPIDLATRIRNWRLVGEGGTYPVKPVLALSRSQLELVPPKTLGEGSYTLMGDWDWDAVKLNGTLEIHKLADLTVAKPAPGEGDKLTAGAGKVRVEMTGADFQFLTAAALKNPREWSAPEQKLAYRLPVGPRGGTQDAVALEVDTTGLKPGEYTLELTQEDGKTQESTLKVLQPAPKLAELPLRVNTEEEAQPVTLRGTGLLRVSKLEAPGLQFEPEGDATDTERTFIARGALTEVGAKLPLALQVAGFEKPMQVEQALEVAGPKPRIVKVQASLPETLGVELFAGELPAGTFAGFAMELKSASTVRAIRLSCGDRSTALKTNESKGQGGFRQTSANLYFLSIDPGTMGPSGCVLKASVEDANGQSVASQLGRVVRLPQIDAFELTGDSVGEGVYAGTLKGKELESVARVGWDGSQGTEVIDLPAPIAGQGERQSLRIAVPWPSPAPNAPLFIWLRGEKDGRRTSARY